MKKGLFIVGIGFLIIAGFLFYSSNRNEEPPINDFYDCASLHFDVMDKYPSPRTCSANGKIFIEESSPNVRISSPQAGETIKSPLKVTGFARGIYYFEASFPIKLVDNDNVIAVGIAQAKGDWMTEDYVPFEAELTFAKPTASYGYLIFQKDNPSGLSEHDESTEIKIQF